MYQNVIGSHKVFAFFEHPVYKIADLQLKRIEVKENIESCLVERVPSKILVTDERQRHEHVLFCFGYVFNKSSLDANKRRSHTAFELKEFHSKATKLFKAEVKNA